MSNPLKAEQAYVTLTGSVQHLSDYLNDQSFKCIIIHAGALNAGTIYFGFQATVASNNYVWYIPIGKAPFVLELSGITLQVNQIYFIGTNTDTMGIGVIAGRD